MLSAMAGIEGSQQWRDRDRQKIKLSRYIYFDYRRYFDNAFKKYVDMIHTLKHELKPNSPPGRVPRAAPAAGAASARWRATPWRQSRPAPATRPSNNNYNNNNYYYYYYYYNNNNNNNKTTTDPRYLQLLIIEFQSLAVDIQPAFLRRC